MSWVAAGVASAGLTLAAVKWVSGNSKEKKAKRELANLKAPFYEIQDEYYQNKNKAAELAQAGLPAATKDFYANQSEKGLTAGIKAITGSGGNPNDVSKIFQTYEDSTAKISAIDAETHINNIKYYMGVNKDLAGQKTIQWAINKQQPYLNTLKQLNAAMKAGEATKNEAYSDAMSSISSFGTSMAGSGGFSGKGTTGTTTGTNTGNVSTYAKMFSTDTTSPKNNNRGAVADPFGDENVDVHSGGGNDDALYQQFKTWMAQSQGKI